MYFFKQKNYQGNDLDRLVRERLARADEILSRDRNSVAQRLYPSVPQGLNLRSESREKTLPRSEKVFPRSEKIFTRSEKVLPRSEIFERECEDGNVYFLQGIFLIVHVC